MAEKKQEYAGATKPARRWSLLPNNRMLRIFLVGVGVISIGAALYTVPSFNNTIVLATNRQPEPFTELYFLNNQDLPKEASAGHASDFSYTVTNHENTPVTYTAHVTMVENGQPRILEAATFTVQNNDSHQQLVHFTPSAQNATYEITVDLVNTGSSIRFRGQS